MQRLPGKASENPLEPLQNPAEPRRTLEEITVEASRNTSQKQICSENFGEGCASEGRSEMCFDTNLNARRYLTEPSAAKRFEKILL